MDEESAEELENGQGVVNNEPSLATNAVWDFGHHSKLLYDIHLSSSKPMDPHIAI